MRRVIGRSLGRCHRAIVMPPNRGERVDSGIALDSYRRDVLDEVDGHSDLDGVNLSFALEVSDGTTPDDLLSLQLHHDVVKVYLPRIRRIGDVIEILRMAYHDHDVKICIHGVDVSEIGVPPDYLRFVMDLREFVPAEAIVLEHIHTLDEVRFVKRQHLHATITAHHLALRREDCLADPRLYCHPLPGAERDRLALEESIGREGFMFGSDSAPRRPSEKRGDEPAPGIYTAPYHLELVHEFCQDRARLLRFMSGIADEFYDGWHQDTVVIRDRLPKGAFDMFGKAVGRTRRMMGR